MGSKDSAEEAPEKAGLARMENADTMAEYDTQIGSASIQSRELP